MVPNPLLKNSTERTSQVTDSEHTLSENIEHLGLFLRRERRIVFWILNYAIVVGLFSLIVPFTVQELVNTFAFSVTPIMVATLVAIMAGILLFVGIFKVLQFFATDILERRIFVRVTLALAKLLPQFEEKAFRTEYISRFFETVFLQRALSALLVDLINLLVGGLIGMVLLVLYHPFFVVVNAMLVIAVLIIFLLGRGGLRTTLLMSEAKYDTFHWFQEVADNLLHFKATHCSNIILRNADEAAGTYVRARKSRFRVLLRQYIGSLVLQIIIHTSLLGTAGWLLSQGELTLGQLVAAEVIVASLLLNLESVIKRTYVVYYFFTALVELDHLFSLPRDRRESESKLDLPHMESTGLTVKCNQLDWASHANSFEKEHIFEALPGEKWGIICPTESIRHQVSLVLAGLETPPQGRVKYNDIDLKNLSMEEISQNRSIVFSRNLALFEGTVAENITMGQTDIQSQDLQWALKTAQLEEEIENWPAGLDTPIEEGGQNFTPSQIIRILLARAVITRPAFLILDGGIHEVPHTIRTPLLNHLCAEDQPWTLVIVTTDPKIETFTQRVFTL